MYKIRASNLLININKENKFLIFAIFIFLIIVSRLFYLQIVKADYYQTLLYNQHFKSSLLEAERGNIYLLDNDGNPIPLTENIQLYDMYADPKFIKNVNKVSKLLTPFVYKHLCIKKGINDITSKEECIQNIEKFTQTEIFPKNEVTLITSGDKTYLKLNTKEIQQQKEQIIKNWNTGIAYDKIENRLNFLLKPGIRDKNYLGFFDNNDLINELKKLNFVKIEKDFYVYLISKNSINKINDAKILKNILDKYGYYHSINKLHALLLPREKRYVSIIKGMNPEYMLAIQKLKKKYYKEKIEGIPLLHGIGFKKNKYRYYPMGKFLSHVLGYLDKNGKAFYGIEEYFDDILRGKNGIIKGANTPWIGTVGNNTIEIQKPINGKDIYLTIDFVLQKKLEELLKKYNKEFNSDSIAVTIIDPNNGEIKAMANYPDFDPNKYYEEYKIVPLSDKYKFLIDDDTYVDIPIVIKTKNGFKIATYNQRKDPKYEKYIFKNLLGPQIFVDKNISS